MQEIDYGGALLRSWRLLLVMGIIGAVVGILLPVSHSKSGQPTSYTSTTMVGAPPGGGSGSSGGTVETGIPTEEIVYYANNVQVAAGAEALIGMNAPPQFVLASISVVGPTKKTGTPGIVQITATQPTPQSAESLANAFALSLGNFINSRAQQHISGQLGGVQQTITSLQNQITQLQQQGSSTQNNQKIASLQNQLNGAKAQAAQLAGSVPSTGYAILQPAAGASKVAGKGTSLSSLSASRKIRGPLGLVAGVLLGSGIVVLRELLDKRLRGSSRAEETFGYPVVAEIPVASAASSNGNHLASLVDVSRQPSSPTAEAYRMLRMSVLFEGLAMLPAYDNGGTQLYGGSQPAGTVNGYNGGPGHSYVGGPNGGYGQGTSYPLVDPRAARASGTRQVILVVSAGTEASRPFVVANLAATYAEAGQRVLVMSTADLHSARRVGYSGGPQGEVQPSDLEAHLQPSHLDNVWRLSMGHFVGVSGQLVTRAPAILDAARQLADVVLVEAPSLLAVHDGEALAPAVDVVLVVGECMSTTFDQAKRAGELLRRIGAPVLGVVLTNLRLRARDVRQLVPQPELAVVDENGDVDPSMEEAYD